MAAADDPQPSPAPAPESPDPDPEPEPWPPGPLAGERLVRVDAIGTGLFVVASLTAAVWAHPASAYPAAAIAGLLAVGGCGLFAWGYAAAVSRSRRDVIDLAGLFWLKGSASPPARRVLIGLLWAQIVVALVAASVHPFTVLAFCVLAPLWGLGAITRWSARYGRFPPRT
ncbi:MAG: hypothetical protein JWM05_3628 [Acidimicrobiales bacterium]|nr:hypothetical protein [Acidimicrobiales bacterium]